MTLGLYFDKSGPNDEIPAVTVAGVISTSERWTEFSKKWEEALYEFDDLPFFHMSEYESGIGPYKDWNERGVKRERFGRLLDIIEEHVMATVGASVSLADCAASFSDRPLGPAYTLTASHCMNMIPQYRYLHEQRDEEVIYTFEAGDWGYGKLRGIYDEMYDEPWRHKFNRLGSRLKKEHKESPPLQAADILAYEGWKLWAREHGGDHRPTRYPWARLSKSIANEWATLTPMSVKELWERTGSGPMPPSFTSLGAAIGRIPTAPLTLPTWG